MLTAFRKISSNSNLVRLFFGEFVSGIGDWLYLVALLVVVYRQSSDPVLLGLIGGARIIPYIVLSVPAGVVVDRYDRRIVLIFTDIVRRWKLTPARSGPVKPIATWCTEPKGGMRMTVHARTK